MLPALHPDNIPLANRFIRRAYLDSKIPLKTRDLLIFLQILYAAIPHMPHPDVGRASGQSANAEHLHSILVDYPHFTPLHEVQRKMRPWLNTICQMHEALLAENRREDL